MDKIRVLLVEDEPTLAMIIKDTLDGEEFEVILAANGEEGLSRYREAKPDIIVTDIMMPKIDGFTMVHPENGSTDTGSFSFRPFRSQRRGRRFRTRG